MFKSSANAALAANKVVDAARARASAPDNIGSLMVSSRLMTGLHRFPVRARFGKAFPNDAKLRNCQVKTLGKSFSQLDDSETPVFGKKDIGDAGPLAGMEFPRSGQ
jgi:hypothetical protein